MAKSDCKLEEINVEPAYQQNSAKWANGKQVNAFDTETYNGSVFMLSYAIGSDFTGVVDNEDIEPLSGKAIFDKITHRSCRSAINVWYNLDFDANAILSGLLNKRELSRLAIENEVTTEISDVEYTITYVKGKFLSIQDSHRNRYDHFDISQFFYSSLNEASEEWLGETKVEEVDTSQFGDKEYIKENYETIYEYAEKDAILTQRLGYELIQEAEKLDIPMGRPFSTGYISAEYQRANTESKPGFGKREYQSMFWDSYYGGRFEVFERGNVGEIVAPDINSAYPAVMRNLPDPTTLDWEHRANEFVYPNDYRIEPETFDFDDVENADYGVVRVKVSTDKNARIQPFAYKMDGKVKYPVLEDTEITVIKPIFEFAVNRGLVTDYELKQAWLGYEIDETEYPFRWIDSQYADRKDFAKLEKFKKELLIKIILNSAYGKTCQTTESKYMIELGDGEEYELEDNEKVYPSVFLSKEQRKHLSDDEVVISKQKCGKRFNPFVASYITGMTRLKLHKSVMDYGLVDDTYMFATDCIMVDKEAYYNSDFGELIKQPNFDLEGGEFRESAIESLGWWDFDYEGSAFIVGSGVYEVEMDDGSTKTKTRGFTEKSLGKKLKELAKENPEGIPIENERPLTIPEVLIQPYDKETGEKRKVSEFVEESKKLNPDFDNKRNWEIESPNFLDLLNMQEESDPLVLKEEAITKYDPQQTKLTGAEEEITEILTQ